MDKKFGLSEKKFDMEIITDPDAVSGMQTRLSQIKGKNRIQTLKLLRNWSNFQTEKPINRSKYQRPKPKSKIFYQILNFYHGCYVGVEG